MAATATTTTLPSFVELMATLGIDPSTKMPASRSSPGSPHLLAVPTLSPTRSRSSPSLREQAMPKRGAARYSPYAPTFAHRRGSISSSSSSSPELERISLRAYSSSPRSPSSPRPRRRVDNKLTVNVFGSSSDLSANTPISSFVRRKTPGASPTCSTFSVESPPPASPIISPMPFTLPTLPTFLPQSASSDSFPVTPNSDICDISARNSPDCKSTPLPDVLDSGFSKRRRTGIRISHSHSP